MNGVGATPAWLEWQPSISRGMGNLARGPPLSKSLVPLAQLGMDSKGAQCCKIRPEPPIPLGLARCHKHPSWGSTAGGTEWASPGTAGMRGLGAQAHRGDVEAEIRRKERWVTTESFTPAFSPGRSWRNPICTRCRRETRRYSISPFPELSSQLSSLEMI